MARLTIPEVFRPALMKLSLIPSEAMEELVSLFGEIPLPVGSKKLPARLTASVTLLDLKDLTGITEALKTLSSVRVMSNVPLSEFVDDVCSSLEEQAVPGLSDTATLKPRLLQLLGTTSIMLSAKASNLMREHSNVMIDARIISDMRPVFQDGTETVSGAVVVHTLKLTYFHCGNSQEFYIALDDNDLASLQKSLGRAEVKSKILKDIISKAGLVSLNQE